MVSYASVTLRKYTYTSIQKQMSTSNRAAPKIFNATALFQVPQLSHSPINASLSLPSQGLTNIVFLRALEYYQGILFLTSNRVGTFDDAFISRIHVIIHYPPFQPEQRAKIWNTFFRRLEKERPSLRITPSVYDFIGTDEGLKNLEWNGREIRNG